MVAVGRSLRAAVSARWRALGVLGLLVACGRSTRSDGVVPAGDGGSSGELGAPSAGASGSVASGGTSGFPDRIVGEHDIDQQGCERFAIGQEYLVAPVLGCTLAPAADDPSVTEICTVQPYCTKHSDCDAAAFGRCVGFATARCRYPSEPCSAQTDCTSRGHGFCDVPDYDRTCDEQGNCWPAVAECYYQADAGCDTDADCTAAVGGRCDKFIDAPHCTYDECGSNDDCGDGQRCTCSQARLVCIPAQCPTDDSCPAGQRCVIEYDCLQTNAFGAYCTTPEDTCSSGDDCPTGRCEYGLARWECNPDQCPID